jgi:hypothetical protein
MGNLQATFLNEQISKFGGQMFFNEKQQRELLTMEQEIYLNAGLNGGASPYGDINTQMNMLSTTGRATARRLTARALIAFSVSSTSSNWLTGIQANPLPAKL